MWKQWHLKLCLCESSSPLYTSCKVSGKGYCCVPCLGTSPGEVARSFLNASWHNCKMVVCPEKPAWLPAGCRQGGRVGGSAQGSRVVGCTHNVKLYTLKPKETKQGEMRWAMNQLTCLVVVSEEMLWNLCLSAISFLANPAPTVTPESWFSGSFSSCCNQLWCLLQRPRWEHAHLPEQGIIPRHTKYSLQC